MTQVSRPVRFICFLMTTPVLLACAMQASAGVRVTMADDLDPGRHFMVITKILNRGLHGGFTDKLDNSFLTAGESKNITVLAVKPLLYDKVYSTALHPAYYGDHTHSDKVPFALRTVVLPTLRPPSWRRLLDSGAPVREGDVGITPGIVNDHFSMILRHYLPAFDRAGIKEDLRQYLPLLHELTTFAHSDKAFENRKASMARLLPTSHEKYAESLKMTVSRYRREMDRQLKEIEAWLSLEQSKRVPMHDWINNFHKADYVYREMMDDLDHERIQQWLEKSRERTHERTLQWINAETGLRFTFYLNTRTGGKSGPGYRTDVTVDLNPILGLDNNQRYLKKSHPNFYRNTDGMWKLR